MGMFLAIHIDTLPAQLLNRDERLVDVGVLGDKVRPEMQGETLGMKNVWGRLGEIYENILNDNRDMAGLVTYGM